MKTPHDRDSYEYVSGASSSQLPKRPTEREGLLMCAHCRAAHPADYTHCPKTGRVLLSSRDMIGHVFAERYLIEGMIGQGGMGTVFSALDLVTERKVALKKLREELVAELVAVRRFEREAAAIRALGHPNIVEIVDSGVDRGVTPYIAMELLEGETLSQRMRRGRMTCPEVARIAVHVLSALEAVHEQEIIHRDLKPDNIFLCDDPAQTTKVLDFGVSKFNVADGEMDLTRTGVMLGTPFYMSPEQARGDRAIDLRIDVYALGVIMYQCTAEALPFDGENYHALLRAILLSTPADLRSLAPELPSRFCQVVDRALAKSRAERYQSAKQMREDLEELLREPASIRPPAALQAPPPRPAATTPLPPSFPKPTRFSATPRAFVLASLDWPVRPNTITPPAEAWASATPANLQVPLEAISGANDPSEELELSDSGVRGPFATWRNGSVSSALAGAIALEIHNDGVWDETLDRINRSERAALSELHRVPRRLSRVLLEVLLDATLLDTPQFLSYGQRIGSTCLDVEPAFAQPDKLISELPTLWTQLHLDATAPQLEPGNSKVVYGFGIDDPWSPAHHMLVAGVFVALLEATGVEATARLLESARLGARRTRVELSWTP